ncbi:F-type H+-transporting ATPase subunit b [Caldanaerobius fijiensis DSM 17918]|uniref:ATP synthase subunit b n=1 Tax=Caldanaerobius fijiensis DSM 17918 TaxID=1121256 RepID=A0A1M4XZ65_9THEO|nr:F0F1 ATP synthase subunit B [Caldanaerobius fijiensis]SHE98636.1 F-type H+-transporting ATPase subunit b [Caldanaerobius fijiensis DSM 17918]
MIDFTSWTFYFEIANLIILYLVFRKYLFKPVTNFMDKRTAKIEESLREAQEKLSEADEIKRSYEKELADIREKSRELIEQARQQAMKTHEEIVNEAKKQAELIISQAREQIERDRQKALDEMKDEIVDISIKIATKVINQQLDFVKDEVYIDKLLHEEGLELWPR